MLNGTPSVIKFAPGTYHLRRTQATAVKYYISNTLSWNSSPDNIKNIGMYLKDMANVTIDGGGATFITHGEITGIVADACENIVFKDFTIDASDPSLTEMTIERAEDARTIIFKVHEISTFEISGTTLRWVGEGWSFTGGHVKLYNPFQGRIINPSWDPYTGIQSITKMDENHLCIVYSSNREPLIGYTFQMRDAIRDQVAGFILRSKNVSYQGVDHNFLGNFGIVCQYSDGITFTDCNFMPDPQSGRTCAGFADFIQVSGCKGLFKVEDCKFQGARDDPINIHGTYLKVVEYTSTTKVKVQFQHHESWGFDALFAGDSIEFINAGSMLAIEGRIVTRTTRVDDRNIYVEFDRPIQLGSYSGKTVVLENTAWTPEVEVRRSRFSRIPTRGLLLTTRRRSVIEDNIFVKT